MPTRRIESPGADASVTPSSVRRPNSLALSQPHTRRSHTHHHHKQRNGTTNGTDPKDGEVIMLDAQFFKDEPVPPPPPPRPHTCSHHTRRRGQRTTVDPSLKYVSVTYRFMEIARENFRSSTSVHQLSYIAENPENLPSKPLQKEELSNTACYRRDLLRKDITMNAGLNKVCDVPNQSQDAKEHSSGNAVRKPLTIDVPEDGSIQQHGTHSQNLLLKPAHGTTKPKHPSRNSQNTLLKESMMEDNSVLSQNSILKNGGINSSLVNLQNNFGDLRLTGSRRKMSSTMQISGRTQNFPSPQNENHEPELPSYLRPQSAMCGSYGYQDSTRSASSMAANPPAVLRAANSVVDCSATTQRYPCGHPMRSNRHSRSNALLRGCQVCRRQAIESILENDIATEV